MPAVRARDEAEDGLLEAFLVDSKNHIGDVARRLEVVSALPVLARDKGFEPHVAETALAGCRVQEQQSGGSPV